MLGSLAKSRAGRLGRAAAHSVQEIGRAGPSAQRLLQLGYVVLPERSLGGRREASRSGRRARRGQAEVTEDPLDHRLLVDEGDDLATSAAGTSEDVLAEDAQEQLVPRNPRIEWTRRLARSLAAAGFVWRAARTWGLGGARDSARAQARSPCAISRPARRPW